MATSNYSVNNILQNIVFCVQQEKETCKVLGQLKGEYMMAKLSSVVLGGLSL